MKYKNFEEFLKERWPAEGVLDDDMPDAFEAWLEDMDKNELIDFADLYAEEVKKQSNG